MDENSFGQIRILFWLLRKLTNVDGSFLNGLPSIYIHSFIMCFSYALLYNKQSQNVVASDNNKYLAILWVDCAQLGRFSASHGTGWGHSLGCLDYFLQPAVFS